MKFKKIIVWMLMLAMILNLPASTLAATSPVAPCKNHVWGEWDPIEDPTCTTTGKQIRYCEVCFTEQIGTIPKLPHSWDGWTVTKEPTCTSTGSRFHTCTVCGTRETETMDKASILSPPPVLPRAPITGSATSAAISRLSTAIPCPIPGVSG